MSYETRVTGALVVLLICLGGQTTAATATPPVGSQAATQIRAYFEQCHRVHVCNGSFLVEKAGKVIYRGALGRADASTNRRLTSDAAFDIGSISKQFTAAAIVRLEEQGRLRIDDSAARYLPGFPYPQITLRQLLTHISGVPDVMPHYTNLFRRGRVHAPVELADVVAVLAASDQPPEAPPGGRYAYSNTGYVLLAKVIETVSRQSYANFLSDQFFRPLGMAHTLVRTPSTLPKDTTRAFGFHPSPGGETRPDDQIPQLYLYGAGGIYSTTDDLARWGRALLHGEVMRPEHWKEATSPAVLRDGSTIPHGFGLSLKPSALGAQRITHGGHWRAFKSELTLLPDSDTLIVLLTNNDENDSVEQARDAVEAMLSGRDRPTVAEPLPWTLADHAANDDIRALHTWLDHTLARGGDALDNTEDDVNNLGYALLKAKTLKKAIAVFEFNRAAHPRSENACDSLADAYLADGNIPAARTQLEAMLRLNPVSPRARQRLAALPK